MKIGFYNFPNTFKIDIDIPYLIVENPIDIAKKNINLIFIKASNNFYDDLKNIFNLSPDVNFIPVFENKNFSQISKAVSLGAKTFILPPINENIKRVLKDILTSESFLEKKKVSKNKEIFCDIVGKSSEITEVFELIKKVADSDSTVLITGESGTGKELVAKAIHRLSKRKNNNFVPVNCGAIPEELLESELFGYVKGAFTGAIANRIGRFQIADKGTLFLDEIGEMPLQLQVKLLRVLQDKEVQPVGSNKSIKIDIRVIAATNKNLEELIKEKKFREDLFYRLNVIPIHLPPLRERVGDVELLVNYFFNKFVEKYEKNELKGITEETLYILKNYNWPGNVRELENTIERLVILKDKGFILPSDLPPKFFNVGDISNIDDRSYLNSLIKLTEEGIDLKETIESIETDLILQALRMTDGVKEKAAKLLGIKRTTLIEKLKRKNLM